MRGIEIARENGLLVARGDGGTEAVVEAARAFVAAEIAAMPRWLDADMVEEARRAGLKIAWHGSYDRPAWPDTDPPLEVVEVWRSVAFLGEAIVFYRCTDPGCLRCRNPDAPWSAHLKALRANGLDKFGAAAEIEIRRGKRRETIIALVDQPVFVANGSAP